MPFVKRSVVVGEARQPVPRRPETTAEAKPPAPRHPDISPSRLTSEPLVATGTPSLDALLRHLPQGLALLVLEASTTDFASVLLRRACAQGVVRSRDGAPCHTVVVGPREWVELPGVAGAKARKNAPAPSADLRIAWRYKQNTPQEKEPPAALLFDFASRIHPPPSPAELTVVPVLADLVTTLRSVEAALQHHPEMVRVVVPQLLQPGVYLPLHWPAHVVVPFVHRLCQAVERHGNATLMVSMGEDLFPQVASTVCGLLDACVRLRPFAERTSGSQPQGLVDVVRLAGLSDMGCMEEQVGVFSFRNGRKEFAIEEWSIPVE